MNKDREKTTILVCSCDKYRDTWSICIESLRLSWMKCPYEIILLTETCDLPQGFDRVINVISSDWSLMLHEALEKLDAEYIIFMLEDQWSVETIDGDRIEYALNYINSHKDVAIVYIEESKIGGIKQSYVVDEYFNEIPFGAPYRLSCAPGIFRRDFLLSLTDNPISPWDFERIMSFDEIGKDVRVLELKGSNWIRIDETGAIYRGKWVPGVKEFAKTLGIELDLSVRKEQSWTDICKRRCKDFIFNINPRMVVFLQKKFNNKIDS